MFAGLFVGCSEYEIDKDTFIDVYKEILTVREMITDSAEAEKTIESIYLKYEITEELFKADYFFYAESEEEFIEILDSVRDRVMSELAEIDINRDSLPGMDSERADNPVNNLNQMTDRDSVDKKKIVKELKDLAKKATTVWIASDEDREGEAIAWHLQEVLELDKEKTKRIIK